MMQTETTKTAPCGCRFIGRIYSTLNCTVVNNATWTGRQIMRHAMTARKDAR